MPFYYFTNCWIPYVRINSPWGGKMRRMRLSIWNRLFVQVICGVVIMAGSLWSTFSVLAAHASERDIPDKAPRQVILLSIDQLTGEDFVNGQLPFAALLTEHGGAAYMHTMPQGQAAKPAQAKQPLQLDASGIPEIADSLQTAGVTVNRFPNSVMYKPDVLFPGGRRVHTDRIAAKIVNKLQSAPSSRAQLYLIDFTELGIVEANKYRLEESQYIKYRQTALSSLSVLTKQLMNLAGPDTLVVLAPIQKRQTAEKNPQKQLLPLFAAGGDIPANSLLSSASTRRLGIVTSADAAASIFRHYHINNPDHVAGQPIFAAAQTPFAVQQLQNMWRPVQDTYSWRPAVIISYGLFAALLLCSMAAAGTVLRRTGGPSSVKAASMLVWCGTAAAAAPLVFLCLPMSAGFAGVIWMLGAAGATAAITFGLLQVRNLISRIGILAAFYLGAVMGDCFTGGQLAHRSVLSYDPVVGIRFYGVGNEYMGVVVGWFLLGCGSLYWLWPGGRAVCRWLVPVGGVGLALFFASPNYGANAGGTITAALAAAVAAIYLLKPRKFTAWAISILFTAAPLILMLVINRHQSLPTHITMADSLLQHGNLRQLQDFMLRKLEMNFRLVNDYAGGVFALVGLGVLVSAAGKPNRFVASFLAKHPAMGLFIRTAVWAALVAFVSNDSGIVAAAMILLPVLTVAGMIILAEAIPIPHTVLPPVVSLPDNPDFSYGTDQGH